MKKKENLKHSLFHVYIQYIVHIKLLIILLFR